MTKKRGGKRTKKPASDQAASQGKNENKNLTKGNVCDDQMTFVLDVLEKQYRNYMWNDGKIQALITTDSILGAGVFVSLQITVSQKGVSLPDYLLALSVVLVAISLILCLKHSIPRLISGKSGKQNNLRAQTGITAKENHIEYEQSLKELSRNQMFSFAARQVYGMAWNNRNSHNLLQFAAGFTMAASVLIGIALALIALEWNSVDPMAEVKEGMITGCASKDEKSIIINSSQDDYHFNEADLGANLCKINRKRR